MIELEKRNKRKGKLMRDNVIIFDHPLIQHKISLIRSKDCGTREFRTVVGEISMLMGYEVMRDLETELVEIETPLEKMKGPMLKGKKLAGGSWDGRWDAVAGSKRESRTCGHVPG